MWRITSGCTYTVEGDVRLIPCAQLCFKLTVISAHVFFQVASSFVHVTHRGPTQFRVITCKAIYITRCGHGNIKPVLSKFRRAS